MIRQLYIILMRFHVYTCRVYYLICELRRKSLHGHRPVSTLIKFYIKRWMQWTPTWNVSGVHVFYMHKRERNILPLMFMTRITINPESKKLHFLYVSLNMTLIKKILIMDVWVTEILFNDCQWLASTLLCV